jgi:hypothetical protein
MKESRVSDLAEFRVADREGVQSIAYCISVVPGITPFRFLPKPNQYRSSKQAKSAVDTETHSLCKYAIYSRGSFEYHDAREPCFIVAILNGKLEVLDCQHG